jgi:hypothetical protein
MLRRVGLAVACLGWSRAMWQLLDVTTTTTITTTTTSTYIVSSSASRQDDFPLQQQQQQSRSSKAGVVATVLHDFRKPLASREEILLSSPHLGTTITADIRGNLGPANVMLTNINHIDWLKDRWAVASYRYMRGTAIRGSHWVRLRFVNTTTTGLRLHQLTRIVLDWETAYAQDYRIDALYRNATVATLFDYNIVLDRNRIKTFSYGLGTQKQPIHVIHEIPVLHPLHPQPQQQQILQQQQQKQQLLYFDELLLTIRKPFHPGWVGVSLWRIQLYYGSEKHNNNIYRGPRHIAADDDQTTTAIA